MDHSNLSKALEFNGKPINFTLTPDGQWWVAIRPICEALDIEYTRHFRNTKEDEVLGQLLTEQSMVAADGKLRSMACLPEKFIYGWLFSIRSDSPGLATFKRECYEVLYNHFHKPITTRLNDLKTKSQIDVQIEVLQKKMASSDDARKIDELKKQKLQINAKLRQLDKDLVAGMQTKLDLK